ncbi:MAG: hypothetical protein HZB27_05670 [Meiothermus silvanus]|nr:hypothetical protein [Allomeiothermus silvanus]
MLKTRLAIALLLTLAVVHAASTAYKLLINGKSATGQAIVVNGQTYVPLAALKAAGVSSELTQGTLGDPIILGTGSSLTKSFAIGSYALTLEGLDAFGAVVASKTVHFSVTN